MMNKYIRFENYQDMKRQIDDNITKISNFFDEIKELGDLKNITFYENLFLQKYLLFLLILGKVIINNNENILLYKYIKSRNFDYDKNIINISKIFGIIDNEDIEIINNMTNIRNNYSCTHSLNISKGPEFYKDKILEIDNLIKKVSSIKFKNREIFDIKDIEIADVFLSFITEINELKIENLKKDKYKNFFNYIDEDSNFLNKLCDFLIENYHFIGTSLIKHIFDKKNKLFNFIFEKCEQHNDKFISLITIEELFKINENFFNDKYLKRIEDIFNKWFEQEFPYYEFSRVNKILKGELIYTLIFNFSAHKNIEFIKKTYLWIVRDGNKNGLIAFNIKRFEKLIWTSEVIKQIILSLYKEGKDLLSIRMNESIDSSILDDIKHEIIK